MKMKMFTRPPHQNMSQTMFYKSSNELEKNFTSREINRKEMFYSLKYNCARVYIG